MGHYLSVSGQCLIHSTYNNKGNVRMGNRGGTVVKVLCYKSEGRWFDSSWCHWNFSLTQNPSDRTMVLGSTQPLAEMSRLSL